MLLTTTLLLVCAYETRTQEIIIDPSSWVGGLPSTIEAIFVLSRASAGQRARAHDVHRRFLKQYPDSMVPLVQLDVGSATPFTVIA